MAKALKYAAIGIGAAALIATGVGAVALGGLAGGLTVFGVSTSTLLLAAGGLSAAASLLQKAPKVPTSQTDRLTASIDPRAFRKTILGSTAWPVDVRFEEWSGKDQEYCDWIAAHGSHASDGIDEIWFNTEMAWSAKTGVVGKYAGYFSVPHIVLEGSAANAFSIGSGRWNQSARLTGCTYSHWRFKVTGNSKKAESPFSSGLPSRITVIGRGAKLYDPRRDSTVPGGNGPMRANDQSTWRYTADDGVVIGENLALHVLRVVLGWRIRNPSTGEMKLATGSGVPARRLDLGSFIVAANLCDEQVNRSAGGTEPRYHGASVLSEGDDAKTVLDMLCAGCCGRFRDTGGKLALVISHNDLALAAVDDGLNDDDVIGAFNWNPDAALESVPNVIRGKYVDPTSNSLYQMIDYPEVRLDSLDGQDRIFPLDLGAVESPSHAQRVAKQILQRKQYPREFTAPFDIRAWKYAVGDPVPFTFAPLSFTRALFRVKEQELGQNGTCNMTLTYESASFYQWDASDAPPVQAAAAIVYDASNSALVQAIDEAGTTANWSAVADDDGKKPEPGATVGAPVGTNVGDRPVVDVIKQIDKSRGDIDGLIASVSDGQVDLSQQVDAANTARDASQTARDQSQAARDAAQAASTMSGAARDAAQTAKTAAEGAAATATQKATDAGGYASTATGQATIATQKADAAGQSASSASANATTASTKAGDASMSAQSAVTAKNDAQGSATAAGTSAGVASQAKTDALAAAKASSDSASSASTSSSAAGQSATAAAGSATAANTSAGAASTSAGQASTSASNAQGSANSAATNSALAASAGAQATSSAALLMPSDFSQNGTFFMTNYLGTWESAKPESSGWSFPVPSTKVARSPLWAGGTGSEHPSRQFTTRGRIQLQPNRRYRFTLRCGLNRYSGSGAVNINLFWIATTADGVTHASSYNAGLWQIPAPGQIYTKVWEIGSNDVIAATYDNRFSVSPFIRCFGDDGNQLDIYDFKFEDITESSNAAGSASAANTSASSAAASRDAAGSSASAANQSKLDAQTAQGQASSSATNAATSASNAAGSSNAAATSATLSAQSATQAGVLGSGNLVRKPSFEDGTVKGWENWFNPSYGKDGSLYFARTASLDTLIYNPTPGNGIKREWGGRVLRIRALMNTLETDGSFGAGLFLEYRNGSRGYPAQYLGARKSWTWIEYNYTVPADVIAINPWCQLTVQGNGSAGLISYFEITDITESSTAAGSASAAVNSASAAKTSQDGAGASAVAANQSRIDAQAANGAAQGAASAASSSAASANSSASQAQTSASLSASYVSSMVPADFSQGGAMWMTQYYGTWNDYKPEAWGWSFPQVSSSTVAARSPRWVGGDGSTHPSRQWTTRGRLRLTPGKRYRLTFRGGLVTYNGQGIIGFDMDWLAWDADGVTHRGATSAGYTAFPAANALYQWVFELDAQTLINDSSAKSGGYYGGFVSPLIRGRGADGQQLDIWDFKFEDITAESKADTNAARIEAVNRTLADQYGALAQRVSNTEATAGNLSSRTGITESAVADLRTKQAAARLELTAGSGGGNAKATIRSDTVNGTAIDFGADNINFVGRLNVQQSVGGNIITIDSNHGFIITAPNGVRVIELTGD